MRYNVICTIIIGLAIFVAGSAVYADTPNDTLKKESRVKPDRFGSASGMTFVENIGQWNGETMLQGGRGNVTVAFTRTGVSYFYGVDSLNANTEVRQRSGGYMLRTGFLNANPDVAIIGEAQRPGMFNYYLGEDNLHTGARGYSNVRYSGLYKGIDALYYSTPAGMKYDFIVSPAGDYTGIALEYQGAEGLAVTAAGELEVRTPFGVVREARPYSYQLLNGKKVEVVAEYRLLGDNRYGFALGEYDTRYPVVIDPCLSIEYATYLGGGGFDIITAMATDSSGFAYAVGFTRAPDFPRVPTSGLLPQNNYIFLSKISPDGSTLVYSTIIAQEYEGQYGIIGPIQDYRALGEDVEATANGEAVVALTTNILNITTTSGAYQRNRASNNVNSACGTPAGDNYDCYVARFSGTGQLQWGTYLGGADYDYVTDVALDAQNNVYMTGITYAPFCQQGASETGDTMSFPVTVWPHKFSAGTGLKRFETFVASITQDGQSLQFGALYGGSQNEYAGKIAVDRAGKIYLLGSTNSTDMPTTPNAYKQTPNAGLGTGVYDLYIARIDPTTETLEYSTYISDNGGVGRKGLGFNGYIRREGIGAPLLGFQLQNRRQGLLLEGGDVIAFGGSTRSSSLPTTGGVIQPSARNPNGDDSASVDCYLVRMNLSSNQILAATYLGGAGYDAFGGMAYDAFGNIAVGVATASSNYPITPLNLQGELDGTVDAAITVMPPSFNRLEYSTFVGGGTAQGFLWEQEVTGIVADNEGGIYIYGGTSTRNIPLTSNAIQRENDYYGGFIIKFIAPTNARVGTGVISEFEPELCEGAQTKQQLIFNSGQGPLTIDSLYFADGRFFSVVNAPNLPLVLDPCDSISISIQFDASLPDVPCDKRQRDSLIIISSNAEVKHTAVYVTGTKYCLTFAFLQKRIDDPGFKLGSPRSYTFVANVRGDQPQYVTVTPDPGNTGVFLAPDLNNTLFEEGTQVLYFNVNATDTGYFCESFTVRIEPCGRVEKLEICARVTSGLFNVDPEVLDFGLISCREISTPIKVWNNGNDTLEFRIPFVGGDQFQDVTFDRPMAFKRKIAPGDTVRFSLIYRPAGIGKRTSIVVFETDDLTHKFPRLYVTSELDSVSFQLSNPALVGGYGDILLLPITYQPLVEGRVPTTELTFLLKSDPSLLAVVAAEGTGTLTNGWELTNNQPVPGGTLLTIKAGETGAAITGAGILTNLRVKVLRGDTIASALHLALEGVSKGCLTAEVDSSNIFALSEECLAHERLLYVGNRMLKQSIPNPARDVVRIPFRVPEDGAVRIVFYDALGREIYTLLEGERSAGNYEILMQAAGLPAGRYYYRMTVNGLLNDTRELIIDR